MLMFTSTYCSCDKLVSGSFAFGYVFVSFGYAAGFFRASRFGLLCSSWKSLALVCLKFSAAGGIALSCSLAFWKLVAFGFVTRAAELL